MRCPDCSRPTVGLGAGVWRCHRRYCDFEAQAEHLFSDQMSRLRIANPNEVTIINVESAKSVGWNR